MIRYSSDWHRYIRVEHRICKLWAGEADQARSWSQWHVLGDEGWPTLEDVRMGRRWSRSMERAQIPWLLANTSWPKAFSKPFSMPFALFSLFEWLFEPLFESVESVEDGEERQQGPRRCTDEVRGLLVAEPWRWVGDPGLRRLWTVRSFRSP